MEKPIACTLGPADLAVRGRRWEELAERTSVERIELPNGLRLVFGEAPGVAEALAELVVLERECCGFADWTLRSTGAETALDVTAGGDAIPVVRELFRAAALPNPGV
jgi:hypothetical protein